MRPFLTLLVSLALQTLLFSQTPVPTPASPQQSTSVLCGALFNSASGQLLQRQLIEIRDGKIAAVRDLRNIPDQLPGGTIDLQKETCLPGLIDTHTHVLLQGDITAEDYDKQLLKESVAYRAIQATQSAVRALDNGFTTIRDLETEGAGYADVDLRNAINRGIVPGPRMKVASRALDVTGSYPLLGYAPEVQVPHGVQIVDGPDEVGELSLSVTPLPCYDSLPLRLSFANSLLKSLIASSHLLIAGFPNHSALHHEIDHLQCADILQRITGCSDDIRELSDIE